MMIPLCRKEFLELFMHSASNLVMSLVYLLYYTECVVKRAPCLMVCMDHSMMGMCRPFAQIFKLAGLMFSFNTFMLKSLSPWYISMLKHLDCTCLWLCWFLWWYCLLFLEYYFPLWGRWSCIDFYVGKAVCSFKKSKYISIFLCCSNISIGKKILGTFSP